MRKLLPAAYLLYSGLIFIILMLAVCPLILLSSALFHGKTGKRLIFWFLRFWALCFSSLSFFWLKTRNRKKVDTSHAYIYTGNHGSYLDAVAVAYCIPQIFSPLGKIEMSKVPVFGWIYKRVVIMIDRSSKESRENSVIRLKNEIKNGISILIFPEGTMNQTDARLSPFYDGAFRIAIETQTPILPFIIFNSKNLLPRKDPLHLKPGSITVLFGDPVQVRGLTLADTGLLKEKVFLIMDEMFKQEL